MESTSPAVATQAPVSSAPQTSVAQPSVSQYATSAPQTFQASPTQGYQQAPVAPQVSAPAAQASAPAGNPWQEAFQALSASLNTSNLSPAPAQYSAYQTPTPQAQTQASWGSAAPTQQQAPYSAQEIYSPQASTQAYYNSQAQAQAEYQQQALAQQQYLAQVEAASAPASDAYLSQISDDSLEVLEHFGAEAPALLNTYACAVEDALIEQVQRGQSQSLLLEAAGEERAAMNIMLTDPDVLADYVNEFFGPNGPYPTETPAEAQARMQHEARAQFEAEIEAQEQGRVPQAFSRPEMAMPTPGRQANGSNDFWGQFSEMMDSSPENAWQYLSQAPGQAFQQKMLVQDL